MTTIIDYGVGNIASIANMLKKVNEASVITSDVKDIMNAERLVLCGIGAFDDGISRLENMGIIDVLHKKVMEEKTPILGICLGMQLFTLDSEEGIKKGLGYIPAHTKKFKFGDMDKPPKVPHMGWNFVQPSKASSLLADMYEEPKFYFVHSFHVVLDNMENELLQCDYSYPFTAAFERDNILGVQFHPEKSHKYGMKIFENFVKYF
jgi:imidazole glycerol-phosphate synthase subunit HisH